jgi:hypothetical protein
MGQLRDRKTGQTYDVSDADAVAMARGNPDLEVLGDVAVAPRTGFTGGAVSADPNARALTPAESGEYEHRVHGELVHDTLGSRVRSTLGGAADALSLGFANPWQEDQEFHPNYATGGRIGGIAATLLVPGAGEAELARAGETAGRGLLSGLRESRLAQAVGRAAEYTPLGQATRLGEAAGDLIGGTGVLSRVGRSAAIGATGGGAIGLGTELSHQMLDPDAGFSGENLLGSTLAGAVGGGLLGGLGSAASEGLTALGERLGRRTTSLASEGLTPTEFSERASARTPRPYDEAADPTPGGRPPLAPMLSDPRNATMIDAVGSRTRDLESLGRTLESLSDAPVLADRGGLSAAYLREAQGTVQRELAGLRSLSRFGDAPLSRLAEDAHTNDLVGSRLSEVTDRLPPRWGDAELRAQTIATRDKALDELEARRARGLPVSQAEEDAVRYSAQLSVGKAPADQADVAGSLLGRMARSLVDRVPGGRLLSSGLGAATGVGVAEHIISHGIAGIVGHAVLPAVAAGVGAKVVQAAFRDPHVGGLIAANVPAVLNSTGVLRGSPPPSSTDPRRALRELADRTRSVTPGQASGAAVASLAHVAGSSPLALAAAGQAAANRHSQLLALLDRVDPRATTAGQQALGRPLPSVAAAREVADLVRMAGSPTNFVVAGLHGRLTPGMMAKAGTLWPATVSRARAELTSRLSEPGAGDRLTPTQRRTVEAILGPDVVGPGRSGAYSSAMAASAARAVTPAAGPGTTAPPHVPARPPAPTPAVRAANPGAYR